MGKKVPTQNSSKSRIWNQPDLTNMTGAKLFNKIGNYTCFIFCFVFSFILEIDIRTKVKRMKWSFENTD